MFCEALRPASVLAKALATLDRISGGRIDVGLGAGWYEPEYAAIGMEFPTPGVRLARMREALDVADGTPRRGRWSVGLRRPVPPDRRRAESSRRGAAPTAPGLRRRQGRPAAPARRGAGRRLEHLLGVDARGVRANVVEVLERECERVGRDPASVWCSLGLYALCGEDEADLAAPLRAAAGPDARAGCSTTSRSSSGAAAGSSAPSSRSGSRPRSGQALGVETLILGVGAVPVPPGRSGRPGPARPRRAASTGTRHDRPGRLGVRSRGGCRLMFGPRSPRAPHRPARRAGRCSAAPRSRSSPAPSARPRKSSRPGLDEGAKDEPAKNDGDAGS